MRKFLLIISILCLSGYSLAAIPPSNGIIPENNATSNNTRKMINLEKFKSYSQYTPNLNPNTLPSQYKKAEIFNSNTLSPIEKDFLPRTQKLGFTLKQFGYEFFKRTSQLSLSIPVDSSYILGPGDELFVYVIGNPPGIDLSKINRLVVDRQGKIYIPGIGVFYVWGMPLGEAERLISKSIGANIKLTVGRLRTFPVYVSGEVNRPGSVVVTGVNTVIDAISMAGGIKKSGTLRNVIITRKTQKGFKKIHIDFYKLLLEGKPVDFRLKDGDVIFVGSIGKVAGVAGKVKRPGIYELKGKETIKDLIHMAGGLLPSGYKYKVVIERYENNKFLNILEGQLDDEKFISQPVKDGDLIIIKQIATIPENAISVEGYTPYPGVYEYKKGLTLSQFLKPDFFFPDSNMKFGLIERQYPPGSPPKYITFSPEDILKGKENISLKPMDRIILYRFGKAKDIDFNKVKDAFVVEGEIKYPGVYAYKKGIKLSDILTPDLLEINTNLYYAEIERRNPKTLDIEQIVKFAPIDILNKKEDIALHKLDVVKFYPKYVNPPIRISGLVKHSYYIPYHKGIKLSEALSKAEFTEDIKNLKAEIFRKIFQKGPTNPTAKSFNTETNSTETNSTETNSTEVESVEKAENIKAKAETGKEIIKQNVASVFLYDLLIKKDISKDIPLNPGDRIVIQQIKPEEIVDKVTVYGYVKKPGVYPIGENTTLYDILKAAGGFRKNAYPQGIVILRKSVKEMQKKRLATAISLMKQELTKEEAGIMQSDLTPQELHARQSAFEAKRKLLEEMEKVQVTGRISGVIVPKDIEKLKNSPYNILLEDGDEIYIPKKPGSILVFGEVYNPSALVYVKGMTVKDYLAKAGGLTKDADKDNVFVIKADGSVVSSSNLKDRNFKWDNNTNRIIIGSESIYDYVLQPGDAVIVPLKVHVPTMWRPLIKDVMQIIYQGAITIYTITKL